MFFFFSSRRRHTRWRRDWSSDVCSSDLPHWGTDPCPGDPEAVEVLAGRLQDYGERAGLVSAFFEGASEDLAAAEIGRASCRVRVKKYFDDGSFKIRKTNSVLLDDLK